MVVDIGQALVISFILMQFLETLLKPAIKIINTSLSGYPVKEMLLELWPMYVTVLVGGALGWFTDINVLPMFPETLGKALTSIGIGLGPSFLYDTFVDTEQELMHSISERLH